jgi:hypothetical protein
MRADLAGLHEELEVRELLEERARDPRALAYEHERLERRELAAELAFVRQRVIEDRDVVRLRSRGVARQRRNGVLVVVEDRDFQCLVWSPGSRE